MDAFLSSNFPAPSNDLTNMSETLIKVRQRPIQFDTAVSYSASRQVELKLAVIRHYLSLQAKYDLSKSQAISLTSDDVYTSLTLANEVAVAEEALNWLDRHAAEQADSGSALDILDHLGNLVQFDAGQLEVIFKRHSSTRHAA